MEPVRLCSFIQTIRGFKDQLQANPKKKGLSEEILAYLKSQFKIRLSYDEIQSLNQLKASLITTHRVGLANVVHSFINKDNSSAFRNLPVDSQQRIYYYTQGEENKIYSHDRLMLRKINEGKKNLFDVLAEANITNVNAVKDWLKRNGDKLTYLSIKKRYIPEHSVFSFAPTVKHLLWIVLPYVSNIKTLEIHTDDRDLAPNRLNVTDIELMSKHIDKTKLTKLKICLANQKSLSALIHDFPNLEKLNLSNSQITHLDELAKLEKLRDLNVSKCGLVDSMCANINNLKNLRKVDLSANPITEKTIKTVAKLKKLRSVAVLYIPLMEKIKSLFDDDTKVRFHTLEECVKSKKMHKSIADSLANITNNFLDH